MTVHRLDLGTSDVSTPSGGTGAPARKKAKKPKVLKRGRRIRISADLAHGGSLSVRHMSETERTVLTEGVSISLADGEAKPVWIQIAKPGLFKGHPSGPFELNEKVFGEIVRNFNATENRAVAIDFEHASEADPTSGSIPVEGAPAQGWIKELKVQGGNLWGLVEWGQRAREYIRAGQYKFFSPAIRFGARDRVTGQPIGARLTSGAMTNAPFLDGLRPLAAKDSAGCVGLLPTLEQTVSMRLAHSPAEYMPQLRSALRVSDLATVPEVSDQLDRLRDHLEAAGGDPDSSNEGIELAQFLYPLRSLVGAPMGTTWDQVLDIIDDLLDAVSGEGSEPGVLDPATASAEGDTPAYEASLSATSNAASGVTTPSAVQSATEHATMSVEKIAELSTKNAELSVSLKDHETKLTDTTVKLTAAEAKVASLSLDLKDETTKREAVEAELVTLREWKATEETKAFDARLTDAFDSYKDVKKLNEDDRESMKLELKADPARFEKRYPTISADKRHLQRNLTDHRTVAPTLVGDDAGSKPVDVASAARALAAQKGIPLGEAQRILLRSTQPATTRTSQR
jgi:hypothetical protein